jgi:hypothetical protein
MTQQERDLLGELGQCRLATSRLLTARAAMLIYPRIAQRGR